jgi:hypothetical protein
MWNKILPPNKSSRVVEGAAETVPWKNPRELEAAVERCSTHHGLVMLLPGQWLEDIPLTPVSGPQHLTAQDIQRLELWNRVLQCPDFKNRDRETRSFSRDARLTQKASHSRIQGNLQEFSESKTLLIFASLGGIYGAVHATSWTGHFPSVLEKLLWQIAVCAIMGGGVCIYFLNCLLRHWTRTFLWPLGKGSHLAGRTQSQTLFAAALVFLIKMIVVIFSASRGFLVVEAFISLRNPPAGTYNTVDWVNWLPHFA